MVTMLPETREKARALLINPIGLVSALMGYGNVHDRIPKVNANITCRDVFFVVALAVAIGMGFGLEFGVPTPVNFGVLVPIASLIAVGLWQLAISSKNEQVSVARDIDADRETSKFLTMVLLIALAAIRNRAALPLRQVFEILRVVLDRLRSALRIAHIALAPRLLPIPTLRA